jgi:hypothetical protein
VERTQHAVAEDEDLGGQWLEQLAEPVLITMRGGHDQRTLQFRGCCISHLATNCSH